MTDAPTAADGRTLTDRGAKTRARLLEAAEKCFAEAGYHDTSVVKITEAAGVAQGTFYLYFASKKEIFDELVRDLNRRIRHAMKEASSQGSTRLEAELLGFAAYFRFTGEHQALYRIIRQAEFVSPGTLHEHYDAIASGYVAALETAMDSGEVARMDPQILAWALMGMGEMLGMRWIVWEGARDVPADLVAEMQKLIVRVMGA